MSFAAIVCVKSNLGKAVPPNVISFDLTPSLRIGMAISIQYNAAKTHELYQPYIADKAEE